MIDLDALVAEARAAREQAYAPYSGFKVGAALLDSEGRVWRGCNIENAAFGVANCAERTALFKAVSEGSRRFVALAVVAGEEGYPYPCGACRQALAEFCPPELPVAMENLRGERLTKPFGELLPMPFVVFQPDQAGGTR